MQTEVRVIHGFNAHTSFIADLRSFTEACYHAEGADPDLKPDGESATGSLWSMLNLFMKSMHCADLTK